MRVGSIEIEIVSDGQIMADTGGPFGLVPRALYSRYLVPDEQGRVPMVHNCLLVKAGGKTIVVDTGIGTKMGEKVEGLMGLTRPHGGLLDDLGRKGMTAADVDIVINTHLHNDHCGGNTYIDAAGEVQPTFPNATYYAPQREYQDALFPNERTRATYILDNYVPLVETGQMTLTHPRQEIVSGVWMVNTPGHTPGHASILFEDDGEYALYVADLASFAIHFVKLGWMTAYDVEPLLTLETKRIWQQWALDHDATLVFEHDPLITAGKLAPGEKGLEINPL